MTRGDGELVEASCRGDRQAFRLLFDRYYRRILAVATGMLRNREDALDVAQETFIKAYRSLPRFKGESSFYTWLYRIAVNLCLDQLRRTARFRPLPLDDAPPPPAVSSDVAEVVVAQMEEESRRRALVEALDHLPTEDRLLLYLRVGEERSYAEIAALLDLNPRTVGTRLYRARARLHALLTQHQEDGDGLR